MKFTKLWLPNVGAKYMHQNNIIQKEVASHSGWHFGLRSTGSWFGINQITNQTDWECQQRIITLEFPFYNKTKCEEVLLFDVSSIIFWSSQHQNKQHRQYVTEHLPIYWGTTRLSITCNWNVISVSLKLYIWFRYFFALKVLFVLHNKLSNSKICQKMFTTCKYSLQSCVSSLWLKVMKNFD